MVTTSDIIMETLEILENTRDTHAAERWRGMLRLQQRQTETGYLVVKLCYQLMMLTHETQTTLTMMMMMMTPGDMLTHSSIHCHCQP